MNQSVVPATKLENFSIGSCISGQEFPTLSCIPALWFAFFAACAFAALGFGLIWIMKLRRWYRMSKGKRGVYFEQRAQLYSPNPMAATFRAQEIAKPMFAGSEREGEIITRPVVSSKDNHPLAVPPDSFRKLGKSKPGGSSLNRKDDHDRGLMQNRLPSFTVTEQANKLPGRHHYFKVEEGAEPRRRVSVP